MRAVDVTTEIVIRRPVAEVAEYVANPDHATEWYANIKSVKWMDEKSSSGSDKHLRIGSKVAFTANFMGKKLAYVYEITEFVPHLTLIMRTSDGPFPMETTYHWQSLSESATRMTLRNRGIPSGFSALLAPFMAMAIRMANQKDLKRLKELLEKRP